MKPKETFYFDEAKYKEDIADRYFSYTALAREIYKKRANRLSSNVRLGMSLVAVPFTGVSAVGTLMCGRNINVESRKLMLLEVEWARRGQTRLPERSWREKIVPVTITIGACTFMIGVDVALGSLLPSPDVFFQPTPPIDLDGLLISEFAPKAAQMVASQAAEFMTDKVGEGLEEALTSQAIPYILEQDLTALYYQDQGQQEHSTDAEKAIMELDYHSPIHNPTKSYEIRRYRPMRHKK